MSSPFLLVLIQQGNAQRFALMVAVSRQDFDTLNHQLNNQAGVDNAWEQEKLEATRSEMLDAKRAAESPASSVSMKEQPDGVAVGHVFGYAVLVERTGTRTRERCVRDQSKRARFVGRILPLR